MASHDKETERENATFFRVMQHQGTEADVRALVPDYEAYMQLKSTTTSIPADAKDYESVYEEDLRQTPASSEPEASDSFRAVFTNIRLGLRNVIESYRDKNHNASSLVQYASQLEFLCEMVSSDVAIGLGSDRHPEYRGLATLVFARLVGLEAYLQEICRHITVPDSTVTAQAICQRLEESYKELVDAYTRLNACQNIPDRKQKLLTVNVETMNVFLRKSTPLQTLFNALVQHQKLLPTQPTSTTKSSAQSNASSKKRKKSRTGTKEK